VDPPRAKTRLGDHEALVQATEQIDGASLDDWVLLGELVKAGVVTDVSFKADKVKKYTKAKVDGEW